MRVGISQSRRAVLYGGIELDLIYHMSYGDAIRICNTRKHCLMEQ